MNTSSFREGRDNFLPSKHLARNRNVRQICCKFRAIEIRDRNITAIVHAITKGYSIEKKSAI